MPAPRSVSDPNPEAALLPPDPVPPTGRPGPGSLLRARILVLALGVALLVPAPRGLAAQAEAGPSEREERVRVRVLPAVGWFVPSSLLYRSDYPPARSRMRSAPLGGLGLELRAPRGPVALRVGVEAVWPFHTRMVGTIPGGDFQDTLVFEHRVPTRLVFVTAELVVRPPWVLGGLRPYALGGLGVRRYAFGEMDPPDGVGFTPPQEGTGGMLRYGVGAEGRILGWTLAPEAMGGFSRYTLVDEERGSRRAHPQRELILSLRVHLP